MAEKRVTIGDIANAIHVSKSSVSRALSGNGYVADDVRRRVVEAARRMGYVPDLSARNLRGRSSTLIGLVVTSLADPFYARLASGFEAVARSAGYDVILIIDRADPKEEVPAADSLIAIGVAGVAITPVSEAAMKRLSEHNVVVLQLDRIVSRAHALVASDNLEGGELATAHLLDRGHRRICVMIDHTRWTSGSARVDGYRAAFRARGLPVPDDLIVMLGDDHDEMSENIRRFLDDPAHRDVTAIFAANSITSQLVYEQLLDSGLRLPDDLSLVAYDDVHWTSMVRPALTVVSQHVDDLGRIAAETLIKQITSEGQGMVTRMLVPPSLIERGSVAAPREV